MQNINLLDNLTKAFQQSTLAQSEQLFKKIVDLAAQKLLTSKVQNEDLIKKFKSRRRQSRISMKRKSKTINKKSISKKKLRQCIIKKISISNKIIHQKYFQNKMKEKQLKKLNQTQKIRAIYFLQSDQEQEKQQSPSIEEVNQKMFEMTENRRVENQMSKKEQIRMFSTSLKQQVQNKFKKIHQNFQSFLKLKQNQQKYEELSCPICIQTLIEPVSTVCGHSFCFSCLDQSLLFSHTCPVCRLHIKGMDLVPCNYLSQLIRIKCQSRKMTPQETQMHHLRMLQNNKWRQKRFIKLEDIRLGSPIDVRDTENIWCPAMVNKIFYINKEISSILVHYLHWAKLYDEVIEIKSIRLAPWGCFSKRQDLPRYNLHQESQNLRGTVINGNQNYQYEIIRPQRNFPVTNQQLQDLQHAITTLRNNIAHRPQHIGNFRIDRLFVPNNLSQQGGIFGYQAQQQEQDFQQPIELILSSQNSLSENNDQQQDQNLYGLRGQLNPNYEDEIQRLEEQNEHEDEQPYQSQEMYENVRVEESSPLQNESGMIVLYHAGDRLNFYNDLQQPQQEQQQDEDDQQNQYQNQYSYDNY